MIENAHQKNRIKTLRKQVHMLHPQQFKSQVVPPGHGIQRLEGKRKLHGGIDAQHRLGPVVGHAEHVIAVVASHVQDFLSLEIRKVILQSVPFPMTAPFGVNIDAEHVKRSLAPGHEGTQVSFNGCTRIVIHFIRQPDPDHVAGKITCGRSKCSQCIGRIPKLHRTVPFQPGRTFIQDFLQNFKMWGVG